MATANQAMKEYIVAALLAASLGCSMRLDEIIARSDASAQGKKERDVLLRSQYDAWLDSVENLPIGERALLQEILRFYNLDSGGPVNDFKFERGNEQITVSYTLPTSFWPDNAFAELTIKVTKINYLKESSLVDMLPFSAVDINIDGTLNHGSMTREQFNYYSALAAEELRKKRQL